MEKQYFLNEQNTLLCLFSLSRKVQVFLFQTTEMMEVERETDAFRSEKNLCCFVATVCFFFSHKYWHTKTWNNRHGSS